MLYVSISFVLDVQWCFTTLSLEKIGPFPRAIFVVACSCRFFKGFGEGALGVQCEKKSRKNRRGKCRFRFLFCEELAGGLLCVQNLNVTKSKICHHWQCPVILFPKDIVSSGNLHDVPADRKSTLRPLKKITAVAGPSANFQRGRRRREKAPSGTNGIQRGRCGTQRQKWRSVSCKQMLDMS